MTKTRWSLHCCLLDSECRSFGAPARVYVNTPWGHYGIALTPGACYAPNLYDPAQRPFWIDSPRRRAREKGWRDNAETYAAGKARLEELRRKAREEDSDAARGV